MYDFIFFTDLTDTIYVTKTIGAYKCANTLRAHGYSCLVIDHLHTFNKDELDSLLDKTVSASTLGVAFSTTFMRNSNVPVNADGSVSFTEIDPNVFFPQGKEFETNAVEKIKSINPNCKIILGGTRVHANYKNKNVDYITVGFSEASIVNLADHLSKQLSLKNASRSIWGITVIDDRMATTHDFKNSRFTWLPTDVVNAKSLPIEIARGCIFKCKFCSYPMNGKKNLDFIKDIELLRQELQDTYDRFGVKTYSIVDDTFNDNNYKLDLIAEAVKQLTFKPEFWAYIRLDLMQTNDQITRLYDIGVRGYYFGIETLNKATGKIVGKGYDSRKQIATIKKLRQLYGNSISLHGSFIIGLPKENIESVTDTFNQLMDNSIPLHTFDFKTLYLERADKVAWTSEFGMSYAKYGYEDRGDIFNKYIDWKNEYMTVHEALELERKFRKISQNSDRMHVPNMSIWSMMNYGYSLDYLLNLLHKDIDWYELSQHKLSYITEYKQKLNKLLDNNN